MPPLRKPSERGQLRRDRKAHVRRATCEERNARSGEAQEGLHRAGPDRSPQPPNRPPRRRLQAGVENQPAAQPKRPGWAAAPGRDLSRSHKFHPPHRDHPRAAIQPCRYESYPPAPIARGTSLAPRGPATAARQLFSEESRAIHLPANSRSASVISAWPGVGIPHREHHRR